MKAMLYALSAAGALLAMPALAQNSNYNGQQGSNTTWHGENQPSQFYSGRSGSDQDQDRMAYGTNGNWQQGDNQGWNGPNQFSRNNTNWRNGQQNGPNQTTDAFDAGFRRGFESGFTTGYAAGFTKSINVSHQSGANMSSGATSDSDNSNGNAQLSEDQLRSRLKSGGYSNLRNLQRSGDMYEVTADQAGQSYKLMVNATTGSVVSKTSG